ncbi:predicted protein [Plenodomus lingam JN3]|uniref:Predicted protein n=1 Tax=Leptosphaeria maculans (strain JN3 / isolate v23.1.3 / race Av1-4-5-6-7-8) TaxID=985895 RepID=E5ABD5_LEPMJ|nr:predicted protein [Plenodomus lingam JN3]CBY00976.1 predicted protein [Plenodomus lingam JN3]
MENRSDNMGSLMDDSFVDVHFKSALKIVCNCSHSAFSGVESKGVKKTWRPGETRDVKGGVAM